MSNAPHTIINIKKKITQNYPKYNNVCKYGISFFFFVRDSRMSLKQPWYLSHQCLSTEGLL